VGTADGRARDGVRDLLRALAGTGPGRRALASLAGSDPRALIEALGPRLRRDASFASAQAPGRIDGFEDLAFLFTSTQLGRGIASLDLDEAAYLWQLVRGLGPGTLVEIGRYRGGSTFLLAAAMAEGSRLVSYDLHVKGGSGAERDRRLLAALEAAGLADRVELVVGDSRTAPAPDEPCVLVFVDGDHSYEGVRADYERWRTRLAPGGHLLFHDAVETRGLTTCDPNVARLVAEVERDDAELERAGAAGSLVDLRRVSG
jgi:predicted O-methyltransferase YrrM